MTTLILSNSDADRLKTMLNSQKDIALNTVEHQMYQRVLNSFNNTILYKRLFIH